MHNKCCKIKVRQWLNALKNLKDNWWVSCVNMTWDMGECSLLMKPWFHQRSMNVPGRRGLKQRLNLEEGHLLDQKVSEQNMKLFDFRILPFSSVLLICRSFTGLTLFRTACLFGFWIMSLMDRSCCRLRTPSPPSLAGRFYRCSSKWKSNLLMWTGNNQLLYRLLRQTTNKNSLWLWSTFITLRVECTIKWLKWR